MTPPPDGQPKAGGARSFHRAFGLTLSIDPRISIDGLGTSSTDLSASTFSSVRLDSSGELQRRWQTLVAAPVRTREMRAGETLLLTVDFDQELGYLMWAREFGRVLISPDGLELLCEPDPTNEAWASIIAAQALPLAATIRGLEVFHASGVVHTGRALLFTGPPGAGKSSLAAAFVRDGARLLSDDAVALESHENDELLAHTGSTVLQLRDVEDGRLSGEEREALGQPAESPFDKHRYLSAGAHDPAPLAGLFLLERSSREPAVERLDAVNPFELIASTFNLSVRTPARLQRQLDVVSSIAEKGLAYRLRVQPHVDASHLASMVRAKLDGQGMRDETTAAASGRDSLPSLEI